MTALASDAGVHEQALPGGEGRYTIYIPEGYSGEKTLPLVLVLHWGGPVTPYYGKDILVGLVGPALAELGAIMIAPDKRRDIWDCPDSETDIAQLLEYIYANYAIDKRKTILTGYSLGGMGTWYLAARNQDEFAAAIPMASIPGPDALAADWKTPLYVINSRQDELFPYSHVQAAVDELRACGAPLEFVLLRGVTHYDSGGYYPALRKTVPWIKDIWLKGSKR